MFGKAVVWNDGLARDLVNICSVATELLIRSYDHSCMLALAKCPFPTEKFSHHMLSRHCTSSLHYELYLSYNSVKTVSIRGFQYDTVLCMMSSNNMQI